MEFEYYEECSLEAGSEEFIKAVEKLEIYVIQLYSFMSLLSSSK